MFVADIVCMGNPFMSADFRPDILEEVGVKNAQGEN